MLWLSGSHILHPKQTVAQLFVESKVFLKLLVDGKMQLYQYYGSNLNRFFYSSDSTTAEPLVCKSFMVSDSIKQNFTCKKQLWNKLRCDQISVDDIEKSNYTNRDLTKVFSKYNCALPVENIISDLKRKFLFITIRPGIDFSSASTTTI